MKDTIFKIVLVLTLIAMILGALSCSPERRLADFAFKNPALMANYCSDNFPSVIGEPTVITRLDTLKQVFYPNCDSVAAAILAANPTITNDSLIALLKKYSTTIYNYNKTDSIFIPIRDSALQRALELQLDATTKAKDAALIAAAKAKKGGTTWMWAFIISLVVSGIGIFLIIKFK